MQDRIIQIINKSKNDTFQPLQIKDNYKLDLVMFHYNDFRKKLINYTNKSGFKISKSKSQAIIFSKSNKKENIELKINEQKLSIVNEVKILGLIFDKKLSWKPDVKKIKGQCISRINILKSLSAKNWESSQKIIINTKPSFNQS